MPPDAQFTFTIDGLAATPAAPFPPAYQAHTLLPPSPQAQAANSAFKLPCDNVVAATPHNSLPLVQVALPQAFQFLLIVPVPAIVPFTNIL